MKTIKKGELLKAMQRVLAEYQNNRHYCDLTCPLCEVYYTHTKGCNQCIMKVFYSNKGSLPCLYRKCEPIHCSPINQNLSEQKKIKLQAVMEFYKKAITKVKAMTSKEINKRNAFKFLIEIDNKIAEKYHIII